MTRAEAAKLVAIVVASYPNAKYGDGMSAAYERMLEDLDYPTANAAVERLLAVSRFPPTIAEIREAALAVSVGETRPGAEAWGPVLRAMKREGAHRVPGTDFAFADPVTARCVDSLGWRELCLSEHTTSDRARFVELYDQLAAEHRRKALSAELPAAKRLRERTESHGAMSVGDLVRGILPERAS